MCRQDCISGAIMKFILTPELGRLAKWLRIFGFDAVYVSETNYAFLLIRALRDNRIILTRNSSFINKAKGIRLLRIKSEQLNQQLRQIFRELKLKPNPEEMFSRCVICNVVLEKVDKQYIKGMVPEYVFMTQEIFFLCPSCRRIYWSGSHWGNVSRVAESVITDTE